MSREQRTEVIDAWETSIAELGELQANLEDRSRALRSLYQELGGALEYHIHLEQLAETDRLHEAVRDLIQKMDKTIEQLKTLSPPTS